MRRMKIETDIHDPLEIPDSLIKMHLDWINQEEKMNKEEYERWCKEDNEWEDSFEAFLYERLGDVDGSLVSKEEAIFLKNWHTCILPDGGGYPSEAYCEFEDNDKKYVVITFCWSSDIADKRSPHILAFKEE